MFLANEVTAQNKYWVSQTDKQSINLINYLKLEPSSCSEWLEACTYSLNDQQLQLFQRNHITVTKCLSFFPLGNHPKSSNLAFALDQIKADALLSEGLSGKGVRIGIIDGGFLDADQSATLSLHFKEKRVVYYRDFVTPDLKTYGGAVGLDDNHGTEVWELIGGLNEETGIQYGLATNSIYYLARTDHGGYERRIEEEYIIQALEEFDKQGVKLINLSLGYTDGFLDPSENHSKSEIDGKTSMLTRALDMAAREKGILIVVAAGNDGDKKWETLSIPADAKNVLTVGASKYRIFDKINYSSIGPENLEYIKPNISVYATLGTSFAAPVITGLAACMMEYDSTLSNEQLIEVIEKSGNFYPYGNNYVGYGVPDCTKILRFLDDPDFKPESIKTYYPKGNALKIKENITGKTLVIYHKKDQRNVSHRVNLRPKKDRIKITRPANCRQSSVLIETELIEIIWP